MRQTRHGRLSAVLLSVFLLCAPTQPAQTPAPAGADDSALDAAESAARVVAAAALSTLRQIWSLGLVVGGAAEDPGELELRRALPVYLVWAQDLAGWKSGDPTDGLLGQPEKYVFTVGIVGEDPCAEVPGTIAVERLDGEWRVTELLRSSLIRLFLDKVWSCDPALAELFGRSGEDPLFLVDVPDLYQMFLAYEDGMDPIFEHQTFHLGPPSCQPDTDCRLEAAEVFQTLKKLAGDFPAALEGAGAGG